MEAIYRDRNRWDGSLVQDNDMQTIATPIDFLGLNYYTSINVRSGNEESELEDTPRGTDPPDGYTEMGWAITPVALTEFLGRLTADYSPPSIVITENGASYSEWPDDQRRIDYLEQHLHAVSDARDSGVPVDGYFVWSLLDNLEWVSGFSQRFGLVHVDHQTQVRTPKASYHWYRDLIAGPLTRLTLDALDRSGQLFVAFVGFGLGEGKRRGDAERVAVETALADQEAFLLRLFHHGCGGGRIRVESSFVDQFDTEHEAFAPHLADDVAALCQTRRGLT